MSVKKFKSTAFAPILPNRVRPVGFEYHAFPIEAGRLLVNSVCPGILTNPVNTTGEVGSSAEFNVVPTSTTGVTYQWQYSTDSGATWADCAESSPYIGTETDTLTVDPLATAIDGTFYRCVIMKEGCLDLPSNPAILTVTCVLAVITGQPSDTEIAFGGNGSFSVTATGSVPTYQWQVDEGLGFNDVVNGGVYSGATSATLSLTGVDNTYNNFIYRCIVENCDTHSVTSNSATLTVSGGANAEYLIVAGGGGGGSLYAGGGGGGAVVTGSTVVLTTTSYPVVVGPGGAGGVDRANRGLPGSASSFDGQTAAGGGGGGSVLASSGNGGDGACAGGGAGSNPPGSSGSGTISQGGYGANNAVSEGSGGGGGGNGSAGQNCPNPSTGGNGGDGVSSDISGATVWYGAGGGGGASLPFGPNTPGTGGSGVGGNGSTGAGGNGVNGSGGGGSGWNGVADEPGGDGGDGVVIIRYAGAALFTGGTVTTVGGDTVHTFTSNGTLTPI